MEDVLGPLCAVPGTRGRSQKPKNEWEKKAEFWEKRKVLLRDFLRVRSPDSLQTAGCLSQWQESLPLELSELKLDAWLSKTS